MSNVAVITRTKNRNVLLKRALESVTNQTYVDWTMVIVNDGGEQTELENLVEPYKKQFGNKIKIIHNSTSVGMESASNIGIRAVECKYIVIHDDDDSWNPFFLEKCMDFMNKNSLKNIRGVITHSTRVLEQIQDNQVIIHSKEPFNTWLNTISLYRMAASNVFPPISFLFERAVLLEIGYYREDLPVLGDWEFHLRFLTKYDIHVITEELANYHHRINMLSGDYSNSVIGGSDKHSYYDSLLRNELLRNDIESNRVGLGYLVNISKSFEIVHGQINPIEQFISKVRGNKWIRKVFK